MKYKKLYLEEQQLRESAQYKIDRLRKELEEANTDKSEIQGALNKIEYRESMAMNEVYWLRETLRLVIVDADKMKKVKEIDNLNGIPMPERY